MRNARYLAELTKFRLAPVGTFFSLLKGLLDDFSGHNVDAAAALMESAGRYLFCLPETQTRISNMLDVSLATLLSLMMHVDPSLLTLVPVKLVFKVILPCRCLSLTLTQKIAGIAEMA